MHRNHCVQSYVSHTHTYFTVQKVWYLEKLGIKEAPPFPQGFCWPGHQTQRKSGKTTINGRCSLPRLMTPEGMSI